MSDFALNRFVIGSALRELRKIPDGTFHCCVTSPPYWGLRDYQARGQYGLERAPQLYVRKLVALFREVRRVLRPDGTLWLNLGDSYAGSPGGWQGKNGQRASRTFTARIDLAKRGAGLKPKDLVGIPWLTAFALRADGWWLRSEIIWEKPNPQPESVADRPTKAHEQVFLLSRSRRYYYDAAAISEPVSGTAHPRGAGVNPKARVSAPGSKQNASFSGACRGLVERRQARDVWTIASEPFDGAHFATFPRALARRCVLAGCPEGGAVLDCFFGSGTVGEVAERHGRRWFGIELQRAYEPLIEQRTKQAGMVFHEQPAAEPESDEEPEQQAELFGAEAAHA